jgi:DNA-binding response OmpR family regulator
MNALPKSHPRLLLCSRQSDSVLAMQREVFRGSGYEVVAAASNEEIQEHIENTDFDVIILNHTLSFADRKTLARKTKQRNPNNGVLVLHIAALWEIPMLIWRWIPVPAQDTYWTP